MKTIILTLALMIGSSHAHAFMSKKFLEEAKASNNISYSLKDFNIADGSRYLPKAEQIANAFITVNQGQKELTLTVFKKFSCPEGRFCTQMVPAPTTVTLPIVYMGSPICGGKVIRAERNLLRVDGNAISIEIVDETGSRCSPGNRDMLAHIVITEKYARESHELVSEMNGRLDLN